MNNKPTNVTKEFGLKVKLERVKRNISQEKLAELADVNRGTISTIERALSIPSIETAACIANALGIELYKLFIFED